MSVQNFNDLYKHYAHELVCAQYTNGDEVVNVAIECLNCNEVLVDYDNEGN